MIDTFGWRSHVTAPNVVRVILDALAGEGCMVLETRKRDGTWVATPVNLVVEGDRVHFRTWSKSGKAKRLRNFADVRFAAATWRGNVTGPMLSGTARLLAGEDDRHAGTLIDRKYPILQRVAVRYGHKLMRYRTQHYTITAIERVARPRPSNAVPATTAGPSP